MADLDAILMSDDDEDEFIAVDGYETNEYKDDYGPVIITNRSINNFNNQISVTGDRNSQYIQFQSERYQDNIDLASRKICIHYEYAGDEGYADNNPACNVEVSKSYIRFGWVIPPAAVAVEGTIRVMPYAYLASGDEIPYLLKELYTEYTIHPGLSLSGGITEPGTDWYEQFIVDINKYVEQSKALMEQTASYADKVVIVSNGIYMLDVILSKAQWITTTNMKAPEGGYTYENSVSLSGATSDFLPVFNVSIENVDESEEAGLSPTAIADASKISFFSKKIPSSDIGLKLALLYATTNADGSLSTLPIASKLATGTVRIGDNIDVTSTGVISIDAGSIVSKTYTTDEQTNTALDEIFG